LVINLAIKKLININYDSNLYQLLNFRMLNVILDYKSLSVEKYNEIKEFYLTSITNLNNELLKLPLDSLTWLNTIQPSIDFNNSFIISAHLQMKSFHPSEEIRDAATDTSVELEKFDIENNMRKDIYAIYKYYYENKYQTEKNNLSEEQKSYFENQMKDYKILGLDLPTEKYNKVIELKKQIVELEAEFQENLDNYEKIFVFNLADVPGLPDKFIQDHLEPNKPNQTQIKVNLKYPDYVPMMEYCQNRDIREQLNYEFKRRAYDTNIELAEKIFKLRQEHALLFDFEQHSDYKLQDSMIGSTKNVINFLDNIKTKITPLLTRDLDILLSLAKKDNITKLEEWDIAYYSRLYTETETNLNKEELKKYFHLKETIQNVLKVYQQVLGYTFIQTTTHSETFWHKDVTLYEVYEESSKTEAKLKGYFYLDLFPRDGKEGHAAAFPFISKSNITLPVGVMACNFNKDNLDLDELETFFHEFGHLMHHISSKSTISDTAGFACEEDFVEAPSQMFEEFCYSTSVLKVINSDLSDEIIKKIQNQRKLLQGYQYSRQLLMSYLDMYFHSKQLMLNPTISTFEIIRQKTKEITNIDIPDNTNFLSSFSHLFDNYDAGYYGYMYSKAFAIDLFSPFKNNELDPNLGKKLKDELLCYGSIRPSIESVKIFLGRDPNEDAFIESII